MLTIPSRGWVSLSRVDPGCAVATEELSIYDPLIAKNGNERAAVRAESKDFGEQGIFVSCAQRFTPMPDDRQEKKMPPWATYEEDQGGKFPTGRT